MNQHQKIIVPSTPRTPITPQCRLRGRTPHTPHTPLTPLTPISTNCVAAAPGSMTSISITPSQQLEESVMSWFSEIGVIRGDLV